jgi:hypothetical protein
MRGRGEQFSPLSKVALRFDQQTQAGILFLFGYSRTQPVSDKRAPKVTLFVPFGFDSLAKATLKPLSRTSTRSQNNCGGPCQGPHATP